MPYLAEHMLTAGLSLQGPQWDISVRVNYQGEMLEASGTGVTLEGVTTKALTVIDIAAGYDLTDNSRVYLKVDNASDEIEIISRRPYGARPNRPSQWFVGYKYKF